MGTAVPVVSHVLRWVAIEAESLLLRPNHERRMLGHVTPKGGKKPLYSFKAYCVATSQSSLYTLSIEVVGQGVRQCIVRAVLHPRKAYIYALGFQLLAIFMFFRRQLLQSAQPGSAPLRPRPSQSSPGVRTLLLCSPSAQRGSLLVRKVTPLL